MKKWIPSFGAETEVLEPKELRDDIKKEFEMAMGKYTIKEIKYKKG